MSPSLYFRTMARESRGSGGRLGFFILCLAVGVAAVVGVAGLAAGVDQGIRSKARELLAADLALESMRPLPVELDTLLAGIPGAERTDLRELVTIVAAGSGPSRGATRLAQLKVVDGTYPFYGALETTPPGRFDALVGDATALVDEGLLSRLDLGPGGILKVGGAGFTVSASLRKEPDRIDIGFASLAPRVFLSPEGLRRSGLEQFGSRIQHKALIKLPEGSNADRASEVARILEEGLPGTAHINVETYAEAQPALRAALGRAEQFLGLVALLSLLIGGIGVGQTVRAWLAGRMDSIAVLKCLGVRPREVLALYVGQTALLGLLGSLAGALAGTLILAAAPVALEGVVPPEYIDVWQPPALARGVLLGVGVAVMFSLPALLAIRHVPPARVFRRDAEPVRPRLPLRLAALGVLAAGVFATAWIQSGSEALAGWFTAGIFLVAALLALAAWLIQRGVSRLPRGWGRIWLRHGLAALGRPGAGTVGAIVALGLGVVVVLAMYLIETRLSARFQADLPDDAPSAFIINIQPRQWEGIRGLLEEEGATRIDAVPLVNARFVSIDGVEVSELLEDEEELENRRRRRWVLTREQRLTWMEELPEGNEIVEGSLWSEPGVDEVSIEKDFARDMGVTVGSRIVVDIQGVLRELAVTSLRSVEWETFGINFFLIVEPGALQGAPQSRVAAVRLPAGREQGIQDRMIAEFPNLTVIPIREVLDRIVEVLRQAGLGVRILGGFTVLAGVFILGGAVSAGSVRRGREVALLKTLGMTRRGVTAVYSVEYALVGLTAGIIGVAGAGIMAWAILTKWMDVPADLGPGPFGAAAAATVALAVVAGTAASLRALARRPIEVLRDE